MRVCWTWSTLLSHLMFWSWDSFVSRSEDKMIQWVPRVWFKPVRCTHSVLGWVWKNYDFSKNRQSKHVEITIFTYSSCLLSALNSYMLHIWPNHSKDWISKSNWTDHLTDLNKQNASHSITQPPVSPLICHHLCVCVYVHYIYTWMCSVICSTKKQQLTTNKPLGFII